MSKSKAIGTSAETKVCQYMRSAGFEDVVRVVLHGSSDQGDIHIGRPDDPSLMFEVKSRKHKCSFNEILGFFNELIRESNNLYGYWARTKCYLVVKTPGKGQAKDWDCYYEVESPITADEYIIVCAPLGVLFKEPQ